MVVFTHGLTARPLLTALRASRAAPIMTVGLDVFVHEVIAAMTTAPWSSSNVPYSADSTRVGLDGRPLAPVAADSSAAATLVSASSSMNDGLAGCGSLA